MKLSLPMSSMAKPAPGFALFMPMGNLRRPHGFDDSEAQQARGGSAHAESCLARDKRLIEISSVARAEGVRDTMLAVEPGRGKTLPGPAMREPHRVPPSFLGVADAWPKNPPTQADAFTAAGPTGPKQKRRFLLLTMPVFFANIAPRDSCAEEAG